MNGSPLAAERRPRTADDCPDISPCGVRPGDASVRSCLSFRASNTKRGWRSMSDAVEDLRMAEESRR